MMTGDYRPISDTAHGTATDKRPTVMVYDTAPNEMPTIGALTLQTLDMQAETLAMICKIMSTICGDECTATASEPKENLMARLAAMQENQRAIMTAVKAIADTL